MSSSHPCEKSCCKEEFDWNNAEIHFLFEYPFLVVLSIRCTLCIISFVFHFGDLSYFVSNRKGSVLCTWQQSMARWSWPVSCCRRELRLTLLERWDVCICCRKHTLRVNLNLDPHLRMFSDVVLQENMSCLRRVWLGTERTFHIRQEMVLQQHEQENSEGSRSLKSNFWNIIMSNNKVSAS